MIVGIVNNQTKIILGIVTILIMIGTGMMIGCTTILIGMIVWIMEIILGTI